MKKKAYTKPQMEVLQDIQTQMICISPTDRVSGRITRGDDTSDMDMLFGGSDEDGVLDPD